jgi:hypothetical protein
MTNKELGELEMQKARKEWAVYSRDCSISAMGR